MKKFVYVIIASVFAATMCITLSACGNNKNAVSNNSDGNAGPTAQTQTRARYLVPDEANSGNRSAAAAPANDADHHKADDNASNADRTYSIALENVDTGETYSATAEDASDRYDTVSSYFYDLPAGAYNVAVYTFNAVNQNTSLCSAGSLNVNSDDGTAAVRVNYYPVTSEIESIEF